MDKKQRGVVDTILNGDVSSLYLTGLGGSGKSEIIKTITREARVLKKRVFILAPTNAAAKNINGVTVHRAFGLNLEVNEDATKEDEVHVLRVDSVKLENRFQELNIRSSDIVIIDEISMGGGLLARVIKALRGFEKRKNGSLSTLLLVGDPEQLPPVKDRAVDWSKKCSKIVELTVNYRTSNKALADEISKFRDEPSDDIVKRVNTVRSIAKLKYDKHTTYIAFKNATLATLQSSLLGDIKKWVGVGDNVKVFGTSTNHHVEGIDPLTNEMGEIPYFTNGDELRVTSRPSELPEYKGLFSMRVENEEYEHLLCIPNDKFSGPFPIVITGDYKVYKKILAELFHPINIFKKEMFKRYDTTRAKDLKFKMNAEEKSTWNRLWAKFFYIKNKPFARHSNFITAHKAQGQSIESVVVLWDEMVGDKLKYVAISRARENLTLVTRLT